jgi:hypothetical protein
LVTLNSGLPSSRSDGDQGQGQGPSPSAAWTSKT